MIETRELTKKYGDTLAVDQLTFRAVPGRVTGFLGPNGAGKSTTMRMILGLDAPTSGSVTVNGTLHGQPSRGVDHGGPVQGLSSSMSARCLGLLSRLPIPDCDASWCLRRRGLVEARDPPPRGHAWFDLRREGGQDLATGGAVGQEM